MLKQKVMNMMNTQVGNLGLAVDEAILAGAMIGSAGMLAAVAVPWDQVLPMSAEQKMANELVVLEEANASFYQHYRKWPTEMTDGSSTHNAAVLVTRRALRYPFRNMESFAAMLADMPFDIENRKVSLRHAYGSGGTIEQERSDRPGYRMKIVYRNMPSTDIAALDKLIDENDDLYGGRLQAMRGRSGGMDMVYYANPYEGSTASR